VVVKNALSGAAAEVLTWDIRNIITCVHRKFLYFATHAKRVLLEIYCLSCWCTQQKEKIRHAFPSLRESLRLLRYIHDGTTLHACPQCSTSALLRISLTAAFSHRNQKQSCVPPSCSHPVKVQPSTGRRPGKPVRRWPRWPC
jgi:hypothetical protein